MTPTMPVSQDLLRDGQATAVRLGVDLSRLDRLEDRLAAVSQVVPGRLVFATSLGLEDQAALHAIARAGLPIEVLTLDTGRQFPETLDTLDRSQSRYGVQIRVVAPEAD